MNSYCERLMPFINQWLARGTRVAIFGTGPHTEHLFKMVPELARVRIVGYLNSNRSAWGHRYRGKKISPPSWADRQADVILCSSFVSEPNMAAAVEHLPCKVIMSHTPPNFTPSRKSVDRDASQVVFRPSPVGRMVRWQLPHGDGVSEESRKRIQRFLQNTAVLDTIIEQFFPFVASAEAMVARAVVRYVSPGTHVVQVHGRSAGMGALLGLCAGPQGEMICITPQYEKKELARLISRHIPRSYPQRLFARSKPGALSPVVRGPSHRRESARLDSAGIERVIEAALGAAGRNRMPSDKAPGLFLHIDDESVAAALLEPKRKILRRYRPIVLFSFIMTPALGARALTFGCLAEAGYEWTILDEPSTPSVSGSPILLPAFGIATVLALP